MRAQAFVDTLAGAVIKRLRDGRRDGVAVIAEGLVSRIDPHDLARLDDVERDAHGHIRIDEINLGELLKAQVRQRLKELGIKTTIVAKNIGYELRCADPIPFDMEYTRDLGYCAAKHLFSGGNADMVSIEGGHFVAIPFAQAARRRDGAHQGPHGGRALDALRHRPALHDPRSAGTTSRIPTRWPSWPPPAASRRRSSAASSPTWWRTSRRRWSLEDVPAEAPARPPAARRVKRPRRA